ncbi:MAG: hypothetical protein IIA45_07845 [Bacteroidetes bacterium]|nr:hypothetical protein [Bacteroidota bacterium]
MISSCKVFCTKTLLLCSAVILLFDSCEIINPEEDLPSYIRIEFIDLTTDYSTEGTDSRKISDAWVFIDNQSIGVYDLPTTFPIITKGNRTVTVIAGILNNGISADRVQYPFYKSYKVNVNLEEKVIQVINPIVRYLADSVLNFAWLEDFEVGVSLDLVASDTLIQIVTHAGGGIPGTRSAGIFVDTAHKALECVSFDKFIFEQGSGPVYLELNYKSDMHFQIGLQKETGGNTFQEIKLTVTPKKDWNKIYVDFTFDVARKSSFGGPAPLNQILFYFELEDSTDQSFVLLDNIKLIHLK